jgi:hypothetical protein
MVGKNNNGMQETALLRTFRHRHEAETARQLLYENGINAIIAGDDCAGCIDSLALPVTILVGRPDAARAEEILSHFMAE